MGFGLNETVGPLTTMGDVTPVRLTTPLKPPRLVKLSMESPEAPAARLRDEGVAEVMLKSTTSTTTPAAEWTSEPPAPVTTIV
jgi:hypothetical protein